MHALLTKSLLCIEREWLRNSGEMCFEIPATLPSMIRICLQKEKCLSMITPGNLASLDKGIVILLIVSMLG